MLIFVDHDFFSRILKERKILKYKQNKKQREEICKSTIWVLDIFSFLKN